jgi:hypothetical protein
MADRIKPSFKTKKDFPTDNRVSVCTDCRVGIFKRHRYIFTNRGYVHQECEDKRILNETENVTGTL